ncbi:MAG TPA: NAD-dependent epimerase/dehydratase family protein [Verrucomicrobiae bacterium]|nr:NAD-dependent epimerase/dehydratase family protein [Verrucomicrobiae bacterium]
MQTSHLVTGAAGFIGSHLVDALLARGLFVVGIDNLKLGRRKNLARALANPNFKFFEANINDLPTCSRIISFQTKSKPFSIAWHLAANSDIRAGVADPDVDLRDTFLTTYHLLRLMRDHKIPQIAFASTSAVYGNLDKQLTEDIGPLFPISSYGAMKLASEAAISTALESFLERAWIFRFPNVVGSRATHGAIYDFVHKLKKNPAELEVLGDGKQRKPYFHVADLIEAMLFITDNANDKLNYFNIGTSGTGTTVKFMAEAVVKKMAPTAGIRFTGGDRGWIGDVPRVSYSVEKLKNLGWTPKMTSNKAVERAVEEIVAEVKS